MTIDPALVDQARALLNRARTISEASAAQLGSISNSHPGSRILSMNGAATLDLLHDRFVDAIGTGSSAELGVAIEWAQTELRQITHGPDREPETREQFRYRICVDYEGKSNRFVADRENISIELVRKIRNEDDRGPLGRRRG